MSVSFDLVLFALLAALSPMAFAATLAVIRAGRLKALAFTAGVVSSQFVVGAIILALGGWTVPGVPGAHPMLRALLDLGFAVWMLWLAARVWHRPPNAEPRSSPRTKAVLERLERVHLGTALAAGVLLGIGGPKRLVLTALAAATISTASINGYQEVAQMAAYTIVATAPIWGATLAFEVLGDRALEMIHDVGQWLARRRRKALLFAFLALAAGAIVDAVITLV